MGTRHPHVSHERNVMPKLSAMPTVTTLALAPIMVPFPPRQAPNAKDQPQDSALRPRNHRIQIGDDGSMVAVKRMLSIKAEAMAETHKIMITATTKEP